ncbi:hypothetical protein PV08_06782 [Exophiala spinifera]|uniref:Gfo/Idh/MocA-like oxidoreductase N-terminal domain-containing protein n=1 Tax=Exophiala spinifera TaxID=91928 RepID=A0A0D1YG95_9EURO|nr:uncharacterized protein PV08_06782 [Exophiala spinifera]KIW14001.1 hypothetical protein PV08_06782 [Exophiala spinifera]
MAPIKIGLVGLSANGSWASRAHLGYLGKTDRYTITALQNSSEASAKKAVEKYDLPPSVSTYGDIDSLAADKDVDLVAISVKVPDHYGLAKAALEANKSVFVEWPLAASLGQAEELTALARLRGGSGVRTLVGLQARQDPSIVKAREMVASGALGDILGTTMLGSGMRFGAQMSAAFAYSLPIENGANLVTIPASHALDALCFVLGEFASLSATLANHRPTVSLVDGDGKVVVDSLPKTAHDYLAVTGVLAGHHSANAVANVVYQASTSATGKNFYWEINGTKGSLVLEAAGGHPQIWHPSLKFVEAAAATDPGALQDVPGVPVPDGPSYNVGVAWDAFAGHGPGSVVTFEDALVRHKMIDAIYKSNESGKRESYL